jgi:hypothetical protein
MKTFKIIPLICFALLLLSQSNNLTGQGTDCKVMLPGISGKYSGGCKKGLAHGTGTAQGMDTYVGKFRRGLPDEQEHTHGLMVPIMKGSGKEAKGKAKALW